MMPVGLIRRSIAVFAGCGVLAAAMLPQQHMHVTRAADGHHTAVVHQHYEPHHPLGTEVGHDDTDIHVQWLSSSFTAPRFAASVQPPLQLLTVPVPVEPPPATLRWTHGSVNVFIDDPPWFPTLGLRAPPSPHL